MSYLFNIFDFIMPFCRIYFQNRYPRYLAFVLVLLFASQNSWAFQDTILFDSYGDIKEPYLLQNKQDLLILGTGDPGSNGIKTFNNNEFLFKLINCENVEFRGMKMGYGIKNQGKASIILEECKNIRFKDCRFEPYSEYAIIIDEKSADVSVEASYFNGSHQAAIKTEIYTLDIRGCEFGENNVTGSNRGDIEEEFNHKEGTTVVRHNSFDRKYYQKHIQAMKGFVEVKESTSYRFNSWKIVKKIDLGTGDVGKLTAYYEGENNKILDLIEFETSKKSGYVGGKIYIYNNRPIMCQVRSAQYDFVNYWFVYGNLLDGETIQGKKAQPVHLDVTKGQHATEDEWYRIKDVWMNLIKAPEEKFEFDTPLKMMTKLN